MSEMGDDAGVPEVCVHISKLSVLAEAIGVCGLWLLDQDGKRLPMPLKSDDAAICAAKHAVEEACGVKIVMVNL